MIAIFTFVMGLIIGTMVAHKLEGTKFLEYLGSPINGRIELNWSLRQVLALFSKGMSERWYEAREHLHRGVFISLLSTLHLIHIVRFDYATTREDYYGTVTFIVHGFQSVQTLKTQMPQWIKDKKTEVKDADYWYQSFVAGHNVVSDFMNGYFV